jgi:hypothetical protein
VTRRDEDNGTRVAEVRAANALEPTAVQAGREADADDNLPDADTDTGRADKAAGVKRGGRN